MKITAFFLAIVVVASAVFSTADAHFWKPKYKKVKYPVYHHPEPVYHHPEPVYHHPEPVYHHPEPVYHYKPLHFLAKLFKPKYKVKKVPVYHHPAPAYHPQPSYGSYGHH
ncbi:unnamed protein product [Meganyctiphanes norvegica]|uniref:Uncharacterized protein n=1 Tax=Meganyctiphanes norvegica TaxID=48144 RepID=A0AAV2PZA2_MEGNR